MAVKKEYSDGDRIENLLLEIVENGIDYSGSEYQQFSWPLRYHLNIERHNLLKWFDFDSNKTLLEVGAGCGAMTGLFCEELKNVVAVEPSSRRAKILKTRHNKYTNLEVIVSRIQDLKFNDKFDYVTSIGVMEYSGTYGEGDNPYLKFLERLRSFLKKDGQLILAIENKLGIKYWAGAPEDHTGRYFDSIENYPGNDSVKTFSKKELIELLSQAGFKDTTFYYPFPDYKFCYEIFSDENLPNDNLDMNPGLFPSFHPNGREILFNEYLALTELRKNNLFDVFSNSFLVFAR